MHQLHMDLLDYTSYKREYLQTRTDMRSLAILKAFQQNMPSGS
jgi:hypothetical protein